MIPVCDSRHCVSVLISVYIGKLCVCMRACVCVCRGPVCEETCSPGPTKAWCRPSMAEDEVPETSPWQPRALCLPRTCRCFSAWVSGSVSMALVFAEHLALWAFPCRPSGALAAVSRAGLVGCVRARKQGPGGTLVHEGLAAWCDNQVLTGSLPFSRGGYMGCSGE